MVSSDDPIKKIKGLLDDYERADERALWELRRQYLISDDFADGWRFLTLILARQLFSGFPHHRELTSDALIKALLASPKKAKLREGRPPRYGPKDRAVILRWVERWKTEHPPTGTLKKRTDEEAAFALRQKHPEICQGVKDRTVTNWISKARGERKQAQGKREHAALVRALKQFHEK